jgi:hypothetical protein
MISERRCRASRLVGLTKCGLRGGTEFPFIVGPMNGQSRSANSSTVSPAWRMIARSVPGFRSRDEWQGTDTVRAASPGYVMMWWLPTIRSSTNPARVSARTARLPLTAGNRAAAMLGGDGHAPYFGMGVSRYGKTMSATKRQDRADRFLRVGQRLLFRAALGHDFGKRRNEDGKAATFLRFKDDRKAVVRHEAAPSLHRLPVYHKDRGRAERSPARVRPRGRVGWGRR